MVPKDANSLDKQPVMRINSDLTSDTDLTNALPLSENANIAFVGDTKKGKFDIASRTGGRNDRRTDKSKR